MKLAFSTLGCPAWTLERVVEAASEYGFDGVEIRGINGKLDIRQSLYFSPPALKDTAKLFHDASIEIVSVDSSASFSHTDSTKLESAMREANDYIQLAARLGVPFVRVFGGYIPEGVSFNIGAGQLASCLGVLATNAKKVGVTVLLETHDSFLTGNAVSEVMRRTDHPSIGVVWDISNCFWAGELLENSASLLASYTRLVHVKDAVFEDNKAKLVFIGTGGVPVKKAVKLLSDIGYEGYLSYEWEKVWQPTLPEPEEAFPQYVRKMRQYLEELHRENTNGVN